MKIIDERGRLFGKINVIDFFVVLLFILLIPIFYFGYKIVTKKPLEMQEKEYIEIETICRFIKLRPELTELISVGDKELNENDQVIGEIISFGQSEPYKYKLDLGGQEIVKEDPVLKQIEARLKLRAEIKNDKPYYKEMEIKIGSPLEFETKKYTLVAILQEEEEIEEKIMDMDVILKELDADTLEKISVGDKELDEKGNTIAEILSLGKIESDYTGFDLGRGNLVMGEDSTKKQISTKMRLRCQVKGANQLYFKGEKVDRNTPIEFKTDKYEIKGFASETFKAHLKKKWIFLKVKFSRVVPEIAKVIQKGDTEKDAFGKTMARISAIISNEPSLVTEIFEGEFITLKHPIDRDILASLDALCTEKEGDYYFKESLAKMGSNIVFNTDLYSISGIVVGIEIK